MKNNINTAIINYVTSAPSIYSSMYRYKCLKALANAAKDYDTFTHEDVESVMDYAALGSLIADMRRNHGLNIITIETPRGTVINDERGRAIGRYSCNVYRMNCDPKELSNALSGVGKAVSAMFD